MKGTICRRFFSLVLSLALLFNLTGHFSLISTAKDMPDLSDVVTNLTGHLYEDYNDDSSKELLPNDSPYTFSGNTSLDLRYEFNIPAKNISKILQSENTRYLLPVTPGLRWNGGEFDLNVTIKNESYRIGTIYLNDYFPSIAFHKDVLNTLRAKGNYSLTGVYFFAKCNVQWEQLETQEEYYVLNIAHGPSLFLVNEDEQNNKESGGTVEKKGTLYEDNGTIGWEIRYQPLINSNKDSSRIFLSDQISEDMEFIEDSIQCNTEGVTSSFDKNTKTLTLTGLPVYSGSGPADPVILTYKTKLNNNIFASAKTVTIKNTAYLKYENTDSSIEPAILSKGEANVSVPGFSQANWISKTGDKAVFDENSGLYIISWTVKVRTHGVSFDQLELYDTMPDEVYLLTGSDDVTLSFGNNTTEQSTVNYTYNETKNALTMDLTGYANNEAKDSGTIVLHYKTAIRPEIINNGQSIPADAKNTASLRWAWKATGGGGLDYQPPAPSVSKPLSNLVSTGLLQKAGSWNRQAGTIMWTVTLNAKHANITRALLDDTLPKGVTYVKNSLKVVSSDFDRTIISAEPGEKTADANQSVAFKVGEIGTKQLVFTYVTSVDDPNIYAGNLEEMKQFKNVISINTALGEDKRCNTLLQVDGSDCPALPCSATAYAWVDSKVFEKNAGTYSYKDNTITWTFTVNHNGMSLPNATIKDELPKGLSVVADSLRIDGKKPENPASQYVTQTQDSFVISLGTLSKKTMVSIKTKVDTTNPVFITDKELTFLNKATFSFTPSRTTVSAIPYRGVVSEAKKTITNQLLQKNGEAKSTNDIVTSINYEIPINPHQAKLTSAKITDHLPKELTLDKDSICLYEASVHGTEDSPIFETTTPVSLEDTDILSFDEAAHTFSLNLPKDNQAYVLKYRVTVNRIARYYINTISFDGATQTETGYTSCRTEGNSVGSGGFGELEEIIPSPSPLPTTAPVPTAMPTVTPSATPTAPAKTVMPSATPTAPVETVMPSVTPIAPAKTETPTATPEPTVIPSAVPATPATPVPTVMPPVTPSATPTAPASSEPPVIPAIMTPMPPNSNITVPTPAPVNTKTPTATKVPKANQPARPAANPPVKKETPAPASPTDVPERLPKTGSAFDFLSIIGAGIFCVTAGALVLYNDKRKRKK